MQDDAMPNNAKDPHVMISVTPDGIQQIQFQAGTAEENASMIAALMNGSATFSLRAPALQVGEVGSG